MQKSIAAENQLHYPTFPPSDPPNGKVRDPRSDPLWRKYQIEFARYELAMLKIENRNKEEQAEAKLRFVIRGGYPVALDDLEKRSQEIVEQCSRDGNKIYETWHKTRSHTPPAIK